jgi:hypothetical protein
MFATRFAIVFTTASIQVAVGGAATCDSTPGHRAAVRATVTQSLKVHGYTASQGTYSCDEESGGSGAGNPDSNTCLFKFPANESPGMGAVGLPIFQLSSVSDVVLYLGCAPASPGPLYYGFTP